MIKGYIFDYGGTLDTAGRHWGKVLWQAYVSHDVPVTEAQFREAYVYAERTLGSNRIITPDHTFRQTLDTKLRIELEFLAVQKHVSASPDGLERMRKAMLDDIYEGVKEETRRSRTVLETLHENYPLVLVSNFYGNIHTVLAELNLDGLFKDVIESAVVGVRKPDPQIFTLGVKALGIKPEEAVVVGDSYDKDIVPAKAAGCHAVWLKGEGWTDETHDESLPDAIISDLSRLLTPRATTNTPTEKC